MVSELRTREARDRVEEALVRFALLAGTHADEFVVIGGLNPDFLAPSAPVPHMGTTDVDLLFELGLVFDRDDQDFGWLDGALERAGFTTKAGRGWQWDGVLDSSVVRFDLLCDVSDGAGLQVDLPGASKATAQNVGGPAVALRAPISRELKVSAPLRKEFPDAPESVVLRFPGLGDYLVAKSFALLSRGLDKDAYDLMFVIMFADGGAGGAAAETAASLADSGGSVVRPSRLSNSDAVVAAVSRFVEANSRSVSTVVNSLVRAGDDAAPSQLRNDVALAARRFLDYLAAE